jgi:hypothetical protein
LCFSATTPLHQREWTTRYDLNRLTRDAPRTFSKSNEHPQWEISFAVWDWIVALHTRRAAFCQSMVPTHSGKRATSAPLVVSARLFVPGPLRFSCRRCCAILLAANRHAHSFVCCLALILYQVRVWSLDLGIELTAITCVGATAVMASESLDGPSNGLIAAGAGGLRAFALSFGACVTTLDGHRGPISDVAVGPGDRIASCGLLDRRSVIALSPLFTA